jgi:hypothetical protein
MRFFKNLPVSSSFFLIVFLTRLCCGFIMAYIYTFHYPVRKDADIFRYFDDSKVLYESFFINPLHFARMFFGIDTDQPFLYGYYSQMVCWDAFHSNIVIRFNALARFLSSGSYYVHMIFASFLALLGLTAIYRVFAEEMKSSGKWLAALLFFAPSLLFWTSGVLKETLVLFPLGFLFLLCYRHLRGQPLSILQMVVILLLMALLAINKPYLLVAFATAWAGWRLSRRHDRKLPGFLLTLVALLVVLTCISLLYPPLDWARLLASRQQEFYRLGEATGAGSLVNTFVLEPTVWSIALHIPHALLNVITEPWFLSASSPLAFAAAIENELLILMLFISAYCYNGRAHRNGLFLFSAMFVLLAFAVIGLSTPVGGAIVRYKAPLLPFFTGACMLMMNRGRVYSFLMLDRLRWK